MPWKFHIVHNHKILAIYLAVVYASFYQVEAKIEAFARSRHVLIRMSFRVIFTLGHSFQCGSKPLLYSTLKSNISSFSLMCWFYWYRAWREKPLCDFLRIVFGVFISFQLKFNGNVFTANNALRSTAAAAPIL